MGAKISTLRARCQPMSAPSARDLHLGAKFPMFAMQMH